MELGFVYPGDYLFFVKVPPEGYFDELIKGGGFQRYLFARIQVDIRHLFQALGDKGIDRPIYLRNGLLRVPQDEFGSFVSALFPQFAFGGLDRKSTRLNSSHSSI